MARVEKQYSENLAVGVADEGAREARRSFWLVDILGVVREGRFTNETDAEAGWNCGFETDEGRCRPLHGASLGSGLLQARSKARGTAGGRQSKAARSAPEARP